MVTQTDEVTKERLAKHPRPERAGGEPSPYSFATRCAMVLARIYGERGTQAGVPVLLGSEVTFGDSEMPGLLDKNQRYKSCHALLRFGLSDRRAGVGSFAH